jgi:hypothetical protein
MQETTEVVRVSGPSLERWSSRKRVLLRTERKTAPSSAVPTTVAGTPTLRHRDLRSVVIRIDGRIAT